MPDTVLVGCFAVISVLFLCGNCQDVAYPYNHLDHVVKEPALQHKNRGPLYAPNRCPINQLLYPGDQENDWICDCRPGFVYSPTHENCFAVFRQGPCQKGFHLVLNGTKDVVPECVENPCAEGFARYSDGNCYELGKPGAPCHEEIIGGGVFNINETSLVPECVKELNPNIFNYIDKHPNENYPNRTTTVGPTTYTEKVNSITKKTSSNRKSFVVVKHEKN